MSDNDVRVLVVDDIEDAARSLALVLSLNGYISRTANDGASALELTEAFRPHCILLDVNMPGIDGLELTRRLRNTYGDASLEYQNCLRNSRSGLRTGGGSFGGFSSGGSHK